jgi:fucose permease
MKKTKEEMEISPSESCCIWSHRHFVLAVIAKFLYCAAQTGIFDMRALYCTGLFIVRLLLQ